MKLLRDRAFSLGSIQRLPWRLAVFGGFGVVALWYGFLAHTAAAAGVLIMNFGYYVMMGTFFWWGYSLYRLVAGVRFSLSGAWVSQNRMACALIGGFTLVGWLTMPYTYKVLYDEIVLQTTAWNLHYFREFGTMWHGYEVEGVFRSLGVYVDKRPFFYPFIVSLAHDLTGYRLANAFWVNTLLMPAGLFLLYGILRKLAGLWPSWAALASFGSFSLLAQNANGSGMEMLNLAMFLLTLGLAICYLEQPDAPRLSALVLSCILLAQTRYESALYVAPVGVVILEGWRRAQRVILSPAAIMAPLLLIPCALHNSYLAGMPALWELREDVPYRFEAKYLRGNLQHAAEYFFDFSSRLMSSWWLFVVGFLALGWILLVLLRRKWAWKTSSPVELSTVLFGVAVIGNLGLLMFYFWGQLDDPIVARLILPFAAMLTIAIAWCLARIPPAWQKTAGGWLMAGALFTYLGFGLRSITYNLTLNQLGEEVAWEVRWVAKLPPASRLVISNKTVLGWLDLRVPSITIADARNRADRVLFHLNAGTFKEVLVTQYFRPVGAEGGFILDPRDELPASYVLEPLIERQVGGHLLRISRVVAINPPAKPAPVSNLAAGGASPTVSVTGPVPN